MSSIPICMGFFYKRGPYDSSMGYSKITQFQGGLFNKLVWYGYQEETPNDSRDWGPSTRNCPASIKLISHKVSPVTIWSLLAAFKTCSIPRDSGANSISVVPVLIFRTLSGQMVDRVLYRTCVPCCQSIRIKAVYPDSGFCVLYASVHPCVLSLTFYDSNWDLLLPLLCFPATGDYYSTS